MRKDVEPWLAALLQAEHLNLLVGGGLTTGLALAASGPIVDMAPTALDSSLTDAVTRAAKDYAERCGRGDANLEDQVRAIRELITGLRIARASASESAFADRAGELAEEWEQSLDRCLAGLLQGVLAAERSIAGALASSSPMGNLVRRLLGSFLLTFSSRAATRERLHVFTTNYDRLIEVGCDLLGVRIIDRFVGGLTPAFRASRLGVDLHYNPPGIRGEPRYLEGVVRMTKLHGSIDWSQQAGGHGAPLIVRRGVPFGADEDYPALPDHPHDGLIVYPNPAKDVETLEYPYAELFRDFASAVCQPNAVLVTYGYGFGDDHVNRVVRDMLTIPSTHLAVISYDSASGRIDRFCESVAHAEQVTLLIGAHFADLETLVDYYLPKPALDRTTWRMVELLNRRTPHLLRDDATAKAQSSEEAE